jgi:YidC/Oxa1 family membrane protein insertase
MDRRVIATVVVSIAILIGWYLVFPPAKPQQPQQQPAAPTAAAPTPAGGTPLSAAPATPATGDAIASKPAGEAAAQPAAPKPDEETTTLTIPGRVTYTFTTWGGAPKEVRLLDPQYQEHVIRDGKKELVPINLVRTPTALPLSVSFPQSDFAIPADAAWTKVSSTDKEIVYAWEGSGVRVEKHYALVPDTFVVNEKLVVANTGDKPKKFFTQISMFGHQDPKAESGGFLGPRTAQTEGLCYSNDKLKHGPYGELVKSALVDSGVVRWIGIDEKYFLSAVALAPPAAGATRNCNLSATADGTITASVVDSAREVKPGERAELELTGFFGPKLLSALDDAKAGGVDAKLGSAVNYGWTEIIARPMLAVLKAVHKVVGNWGVAIIVLTLLIKLLTFWPTQKSMKSMREMAKLKPEIDKLKARYGDDKQKFNMAYMQLLKERGMNPLGGCLPMLIQMPIYIALYSMLGNSVELYRSSFVLWIQDLTAADPYFVMPVATGVLMFVQQRMSPTPPDAQQKMLMYMMPIMFTAFTVFLPSGLAVYILTNTILMMVQQLIINRSDSGSSPSKSTATTRKPAKA